MDSENCPSPRHPASLNDAVTPNPRFSVNYVTVGKILSPLLDPPERDVAAVLGIVKGAMVDAMASLFPEVPIEVEARVCTNWGEK